MKNVAKMPNGFVIHGMTPDWITKGARVSAWYDHDGNVLNSEILTRYNTARPVVNGAAVSNYIAREGRIHAAIFKNQPNQ